MTYNFQPFPCVKDKHFAITKELDLLEYEIDEEGNVAAVIWANGLSYQSSRRDDIPKVLEWTTANNFGEWHYCHEGQDIVFYFKKRSDAVRFKLVWG